MFYWRKRRIEEFGARVIEILSLKSFGSVV